MNKKEPDKITIQSIDPDTGYINARAAHEARLVRSKPPSRSFAEFLRNLKPKKRELKLPIDQQIGKKSFLGH